MDQETAKGIIDGWGLRGLGASLVVGAALEVYMIRAGVRKVNVPLSIVSTIIIGCAGWISFSMWHEALPRTVWKPLLYSVLFSGHTWLLMKLLFEGTIAQIIMETLIPDNIKKILKRRKHD